MVDNNYVLGLDCWRSDPAKNKNIPCITELDYNVGKLVLIHTQWCTHTHKKKKHLSVWTCALACFYKLKIEGMSKQNIKTCKFILITSLILILNAHVCGLWKFYKSACSTTCFNKQQEKRIALTHNKDRFLPYIDKNNDIYLVVQCGTQVEA